MIDYDLPIKSNKFETKDDVLKGISQILKPISEKFIYDDTRICIDNNSSVNDDMITGIEGFSRILWGLASDTRMNSNKEIWQKVINGIKNGTNPNHKYYWGKVHYYDQRLVEMAAIGFGLIYNREKLWEALTNEEKENLYNWLDQINYTEVSPNNWKFFRVMVNVAFKTLGLEYNKEEMEIALDDADKYYYGNGWYRDGEIETRTTDYYTPFAIHFYSLIYAHNMEDIDPRRCKVFKDRAVKFANEFIYYFQSDGGTLPYGRSLGYKFAMGSFWSMFLVNNLKCNYEIGVIKNIVLNHIRYWISKPIFTQDGLLITGYQYPNVHFVEEYLAPSSMYWAMKYFTLALIPDHNEFWNCEEKKFPLLQDTKVIPAANFVIKRDENHIIAYCGGIKPMPRHLHGECKYSKFAYSSYFGFNVPTSHIDFDYAAFDNMLAISEDEKYFRHRLNSEEIIVNENFIYSKWKVYNDVSIESYIILLDEYYSHIRVHFVDTGRNINARETGFSIPLEGVRETIELFTNEDSGLCYSTKYGFTYIYPLFNGEILKFRQGNNTNIMSPRAYTPAVQWNLDKGKHIIGAFISGNKGKLNCEQPIIEIDDNIKVIYKSKEYFINLISK